MNKLQAIAQNVKQNVKSGKNTLLLYGTLSVAAMCFINAKPLHAQAMSDYAGTEAVTQPYSMGSKAITLTRQDKKLIKAINAQDTVAMQKAIDKGANVYFKDADNCGIWQIIAAGDKPIAAEEMLKYNGKYNEPDTKGITPPERAALLHNDKMVNFFNSLDAGNAKKPE